MPAEQIFLWGSLETDATAEGCKIKVWKRVYSRFLTRRINFLLYLFYIDHTRKTLEERNIKVVWTLSIQNISINLIRPHRFLWGPHKRRCEYSTRTQSNVVSWPPNLTGDTEIPRRCADRYFPLYAHSEQKLNKKEFPDRLSYGKDVCKYSVPSFRGKHHLLRIFPSTLRFLIYLHHFVAKALCLVPDGLSGFGHIQRMFPMLTFHWIIYNKPIHMWSFLNI